MTDSCGAASVCHVTKAAGVGDAGAYLRVLVARLG